MLEIAVFTYFVDKKKFNELLMMTGFSRNSSKIRLSMNRTLTRSIKRQRPTSYQIWIIAISDCVAVSLRPLEDRSLQLFTLIKRQSTLVTVSFSVLMVSTIISLMKRLKMFLGILPAPPLPEGLLNSHSNVPAKTTL